MGFLDSLKAWLNSETSEISDAKRGLESRMDSDLSKRERQLDETPAEAMERLQQEIADGESSLGAIEDKIGHAQAKADAISELTEEGSESGDASSAQPKEDILDLPSEELDTGDFDTEDFDPGDLD